MSLELDKYLTEYVELYQNQSSTPILETRHHMKKVCDVLKSEYNFDAELKITPVSTDILIKGQSLYKAINTSGLVKKKVQITNPKTGKTYWAYRWVKQGEDTSHEGTKTSKYFNELTGTGVEKIQQVISDNNRNKTEKVRDLVALGIFNKKLLCELTNADPATPYDVVKTAGIPREIESQRPDLMRPTSLTSFPTPVEVDVENETIHHHEDDFNSLLEQEVQAMLEEKGLDIEDEEEINPITGKDSVDTTMDIFTDLVAKKMRKLAIFYGVGGVGKTYGVKQVLTNPETLNSEGKPFGNELVEYDVEVNPDKDQYDFVKITGKVTPQKLFRTLYEHNGKLILFDDCDSILLDEDSVNMLKAATDTTLEAVTYDGGRIKDSKGEEYLPKSFLFRGSVIIISNLTENKLRQVASPLLESRAFSLDTSRTMEETIEKLDRIKDLMPFEDASGEPIEVSKEARQAAVDFIKAYRDMMPITQVNGRTLGGLALLYQQLGLNSPRDLIKNPQARSYMNVTTRQIKEFLKKKKQEEIERQKKQRILANAINKHF